SAGLTVYRNAQNICSSGGSETRENEVGRIETERKVSWAEHYGKSGIVGDIGMGRKIEGKKWMRVFVATWTGFLPYFQYFLCSAHRFNLEDLSSASFSPPPCFLRASFTAQLLLAVSVQPRERLLVQM
ncbi:unnamed protein product, partial [Protopolystoma xenopodis]